MPVDSDAVGVARSPLGVAFAIEQPADVDVGEVIV